jgi:hypothetical protein
LWGSGWRHTRRVKELNAYAATKPGLTFAILVNQRNNPLNRKIKATKECRRWTAEGSRAEDRERVIQMSACLSRR